MEYKLTKCPVCGSIEIQLIAREASGDDIYCVYKCLSCDSICKGEPHKEINIKRKNNVISAKDIYEQNKNSVVEIYASFNDATQAGTGVIINDCYILTNAHVLLSEKQEPSDIISINLPKCKEGLSAEIECYDLDNDLALLVTKSKIGKPVSLSSSKVCTGDSCYIIGNQKGQGVNMVDGIISDSSRVVCGQEYIMFSALVTTGNSGGPLFDEKGKLIGIVTSGYKGAVGMNYAIPLSNETLIDYINDYFKR